MVPGTTQYAVMSRTWSRSSHHLLYGHRSGQYNSPESRPWRITTGEARAPWYRRRCRRVGLTAPKNSLGPRWHACAQIPCHPFVFVKLLCLCSSCLRFSSCYYLSAAVVSLVSAARIVCPPFSSDRPSTTNINNIIIVVIPQQVNRRRTRAAVVDRCRRGFSLKTGECSTEKWPVVRMVYSTRHSRTGIKLIRRPSDWRNTIVVSLVVVVVVRPRQLLVSRVRALARRCVVSRPRDLAGSRFLSPKLAVTDLCK